MKKTISQSALALLTGALMFISSCSKHDSPTPGSFDNQNLDKRTKTLIGRLPQFILTKGVPQTQEGDGGSSRDNGFSFSDPNSGLGFTVSASGFSYSQNGNTIFRVRNNLNLCYNICK